MSIEYIVVTGMHRSGTSIVSKLLSDMGVPMGDTFHEKQAANPDGFFEDLGFVEIHERALRNHGVSWNTTKPVKLDPEEVKALAKDYASYIAGRGDISWGVKDPRLCLFIEEFHKSANHPKYIYCKRNNVDVAESLLVRDGIERSRSFEVQELYEDSFRSFVTSENPDVLVVNYDDLLNEPKEMCEKLVSFCNLNIDEAEVIRICASVDKGTNLKAKKRKQLYKEIFSVAIRWVKTPRPIPKRVASARLKRWLREFRNLHNDR